MLNIAMITSQMLLKVLVSTDYGLATQVPSTNSAQVQQPTALTSPSSVMYNFNNTRQEIVVTISLVMGIIMGVFLCSLTCCLYLACRHKTAEQDNYSADDVRINATTRLETQSANISSLRSDASRKTINNHYDKKWRLYKRPGKPITHSHDLNITENANSHQDHSNKSATEKSKNSLIMI